MRLTHIRALSFDLDDTLWPFHVSLTRAEAALRAWLLAHAPRTERLLAEADALARLRDDIERSRADLAGNFRELRIESIRQVLTLAGEDTRLTTDAYDVFFETRQKVEFFDDVWPALQWLSERFPLIAVSNGNADLTKTGGAEFFRAALSAGTFGVSKPEAEIFHAAAQAAGVAPQEMLHVGDDFHLDVVGALNAGMMAAWLVREPSASNAASQDSPHLTIGDLHALCHALGGPERV